MRADRYYKKYVEKLINANPTTITMQRRTEEDDGYGGKVETLTDLLPQTVTFYMEGAQHRGVRVTVRDKGIIVGGRVVKMLMKATGGVQEGDTFRYEGETLQVVRVADYRGICRQVELEAIG